MVMMKAKSGSLLLWARSSRMFWSLTIMAVPLALRVSFFPGMMKSRPTFGFSIIFVKLSALRLPRRSGMAMVVGFIIFMKPAGSPLGDASCWPCLLAVLRMMKGVFCMKL